VPRNQSEAIVLRAQKLGDQDKLVVLFSPIHGLIEGVAKGAMKSRHRFGCSLEPMSHVKVFYYEKENNRYVTVGNCDLIEDYIDLQSDPDILFTFALFTELVEVSRPSGENDELLFRLLRETLRAFKGGGRPDALTAYFEAWYLRISGFLPDFRACKGCGADGSGGNWLSPQRDGMLCGRCAELRRDPIPEGLQEFLIWTRKNPPPWAEQGPPVDEERMRGIRRALETLIVYHLERVPRALNYLKLADNGEG